MDTEHDKQQYEADARPVLEAPDIARVLTRIAHEIVERAKGADDVVLLGIPTRGVFLARRLADKLEEITDRKIPVGSLDITMYRDDLRMHPPRALARTEIPGDGIDGRLVVLVDDVLFSGRTIRAALDALNDIGSTARRAARGPRRPGPPRTAHPRRLRRQEPPHVVAGDGQGPARRGGRSRHRAARCQADLPGRAPVALRPVPRRALPRARMPESSLNFPTEPDRCSVISSRPPTSPATTPS